MRIAIDCRWLADEKTTVSSRVFSLLPFLIKSGGGHSWLLLSNKPIKGLPEGDQVETLIFGNTLNQSVAKSWWYDHSLPEVLRKQKADLFLGAGGMVSQNTVVPQVALLHNLLEYQQGLDQYIQDQRWYRKRLDILFQKSAMILVDYTERQALSRYQDQPAVFAKFAATGWFGNAYLSESAGTGTENLKQQLTAGKEYFFCQYGWQKTEQGLALLLAFAAFKKRMQSGIRLILLGNPAKPEVWEKKLNSFRYKEEVLVLASPPDGFSPGDLLKQAFACLHLPEQELVAPFIEALQLGTPVIAAPYPVYDSIAGGQVYFTGNEQGESLADRLMQIYRDDTVREKRRQLALDKTRHCTPENTALHLLKLVEDRFFSQGGLSLDKD